MSKYTPNMPLEVGNIIFYCPKTELDKRMCKRKDIEFDQAFADNIDLLGKFYFVIDYDYNYRVAPARIIDKLKIPSGPWQQRFEECMQDYLDIVEKN